MLTQLYIQNVAVIQKASIRFGAGLNVFTGETGAGKTILISAIDAVLGERTSREIIRSGEEKAVISALFEEIPGSVRDKLSGLGYEDDEGSLLITREITTAGKSTCKIGGMPATASILKEIASLLIHIHGQRDSQQLLLPERHMELLDAYGELADEIDRYREAYEGMQEIRRQLDSINMDEAQKAQRIDMLAFQINEIESAGLEDEDEEDNLLARRKMIRNSERIVEGLSAAYNALDGVDELEGINTLFDQLLAGMNDAGQYVDQFAPVAQRLEEISYELADCAGEIRSYLDDFEFDPRELDSIEYRLDTIHKLKKKYGGSVAEILEFCARAREELESIQTSDQRMQQLAEALQLAKEEVAALAQKLSKKRIAASKSFLRQVEEELAFLDMPAVKLSLAHREKPLSPDGCDDIEFLIVTNVGEEPKPLSKIASGGEIARIMLAIKNVLADRDQIGTLIFDEVDTGVSGRAAQKIGQKLGQVSRDRQVICVTHLAQVAAFADNHLLIAKEVENGRTYTRVHELDEEAAVSELARITSGDLITDLALQNAKELHDYSRKKLLDN